MDVRASSLVEVHVMASYIVPAWFLFTLVFLECLENSVMHWCSFLCV